MNRLQRGWVVLALCVLAMGTAWAAVPDLQGILDQHDPKTDSPSSLAQTVTAVVASATASAGGDTKKLEQVVENIIKVLEEIIKIFEGELKDFANGIKDEGGSKKEGGSYTVVSGDSLWKIAEQFLGDGSRYMELVEANKDKYPSLLKNPNLIYPGWELTIPGGGSTASTTPGGATSGGTTSGGSTTPGDTGATGSLQQKIVSEAQKLVGRTNFPYDPATNGGRLGCAQVATTALKAAGAVSRVVLGVLSAIDDLKARGWKEVSVPPFTAGDVITWKTYDRNGDGRDDPDTHIGIIMSSGNSVQAMSNSSSRRMPALNSATYMPISRVLRKS